MLDDRHIARAATLLKEGRLVAFPTETVYGLGANALDNHAVAEIFAAKGRPKFNPLIVHLPDAEAAKHYVQWNEQAEQLTKTLWPGPLTLVLKRQGNCRISLLASAGLDTLAVRVPAHPLAHALLAQAAVPVAAPSANRSGRVSPTLAAHVQEELGGSIAMILDGGPCEVGLESTVIDLSGATPLILRPGAVTREQIAGVLRRDVGLAMQTAGPLHSPGMMESHYAPTLPLRLNALRPEAGEALLAFGLHVPAGAKHTMNLSERGDLKEAAAHLFAYLRVLDAPGYSAIAVMPIPGEGLGEAINDRLKRAAKR